MKKILIIAYFYGTDGSAMSEYVRDRIIGFEMNGYTVDLVTSINVNNLYRRKNTIYVPSLGFTMFIREMKTSKHYFAIRKLFLFPIILSFGTLVDLAERTLLKRIGDGYWSWMPFATIVVFFKRMLINYELVISTGGPASAHLINVFSSLPFKTKGVVELQDPLVGHDIGHNILSNILLNQFELFLHKRVKKIIHISKNALQLSISNSADKNKYAHYYPSSRKFNFEKKINVLVPNIKTIKIVHIGSIYSSRNFLKLKNVIDKLDFSQYSIPDISLINIGSIADKDVIKFKSNTNKFMTFKSMPRERALSLGQNSDLLLLLQHEDERSKITLPYKIWDYLNLHKPIFAILNNCELKNLLDNLGHYTCKTSDEKSIEETFKKFLADYLNHKEYEFKESFSLKDQTSEFIRITK